MLVYKTLRSKYKIFFFKCFHRENFANELKRETANRRGI